MAWRACEDTLAKETRLQVQRGGPPGERRARDWPLRTRRAPRQSEPWYRLRQCTQRARQSGGRPQQQQKAAPRADRSARTPQTRCLRPPAMLHPLLCHGLNRATQRPAAGLAAQWHGRVRPPRLIPPRKAWRPTRPVGPTTSPPDARQAGHSAKVSTAPRPAAGMPCPRLQACIRSNLVWREWR